MPFDRKIISTARAAAAVGPYSQAVQVNGFIFTSGQIALNSETGRLIEGGTAAQTQQAMENLENILTAAGSSLENVVKTTIFVTDIGDFGTVNKVYGSFFTDEPPARSTVQVAALPLGASIEIEAVAVMTKG